MAIGKISIESAYMYFEAKDSTETRDVSGPLDTQISSDWHFGKAILTGYANLPTGSDSLDAADAALARDVARNDLNFPIKSFGQGFDYGGAITLAHQVDHWAISLGGGYIVRGAYTPIAGASDYNPGNELTLTAGFSYASGNWTFGLDTSGHLIYVDRLARTPVFRNGKQIVGRGSIKYESRRIRLTASATEILRLKNREMVDGALLYEDRDSNGNDFRARGNLSLMPFPGITLFAEGDYKDITENAYDAANPLYQGTGRLWAYGGGLSIRLGTTEALTLRLIRGDGWLNDRQEDVETLNARVSVRLFF
tara:strand:- start:28 stop:954 length:927 start_codon:yes stop_codon:yes gene_type:complete